MRTQLTTVKSVRLSILHDDDTAALFNHRKSPVYREPIVPNHSSSAVDEPTTVFEG